MTPSAGLARVTVSAPQRRIDVALPEHVPVAELLPELLRHAGEALADDGEQHGGWLLRRTDGAAVRPQSGLHAQGIRDGEILHLVPAREDWPELEYDDVTEAIAAGARRIGPGWSPRATRLTAIAVAGAVLAAGLISRPRWTIAVGVAALLILAGVIASRAYGNGPAGAALAAYALPYAFAGGAGLVAGGTPRLLVGSTALLLAAALGAAGVGTAPRVFVAGATAGTVGAGAALLAFWLPAQGAAAVVLAVLACGIGVIPLLAIRFGKLPLPAAATPPLDGERPHAVATERPDRGAVLAAVRRGDEMLTGMLFGHAAATGTACLVLVHGGGVAGRLLVGIAGGVLLLRSRLFAAVRQRIAVLVAGLSALAALAAGVVPSLPAAAVVPAAVVLALAVMASGMVYAARPPSPYLGRAADMLDVVLVVSVVPVACAVLGLYARMRGLIG